MPYKDKEVHKEYRRARREQVTEWLNQIKSAQGCVDCGWNEHPAGLEFDHVDPKVYAISTMRHHSRESILAELSKCEVVCGTCHNLRTYYRRIGV